TLPPRPERHLAPRASGSAGKGYVDEGAGAVDGAPLADRGRPGDALPGEGRDGVEAAEAARRPTPAPLRGPQRRPDRAGLATVRMEDDVGIGNPALDEVDLRLDDSLVEVGSALEHEGAPGGAKILELPRIDPDVHGQHRCQGRHDLLGRPAFALL